MNSSNIYKQLQVVAWDKESKSPDQQEIDEVLKYSLTRTRVQDTSNITIWQPHLDTKMHKLKIDDYLWLGNLGCNIDYKTFKEANIKTIWWIMNFIDDDLMEQYKSAETKLYVCSEFLQLLNDSLEKPLNNQQATVYLNTYFRHHRALIRKILPGFYMQLQDVKQNFIDRGYYTSLNNKVCTNPKFFNEIFSNLFPTSFPVCTLSIGTVPRIVKHRYGEVSMQFSDDGSRINFNPHVPLEDRKQITKVYWWDKDNQALGDELSYNDKISLLNY